MERLPAVIRGRPLTLECWKVGHGYLPAARALAGARRDGALADQIADRARAEFAAPPSAGPRPSCIS